MTTDTRALTPHTITANGIRQYIADAGERAVVVLLHGFREPRFAWRHPIRHRRGNV
ncbi:hypothetical protein [Burkholderia sp. Nafp2/4-1b]|uniref:hypothetical protein n=1 Tax=Burkholderia sp. Nafp2/4-1b TaxID=2116686 RepID=UPI001F095933|nr:hypothetical protein [Burkholderia sp. Nafp2/4-1b]